MRDASWAAAPLSPRPNQVRKMPVVKVPTPKYCTAPKSASASMSDRVSPAMIAGRARGRATAKKERQGPQPRVRLTSRTQTDCSRKAARASR